MELTYDPHEAIREQRCFILYKKLPGEWGNYGKKCNSAEVVNWLKDAPDIKVQTLSLLSLNGIPKFALVFADPFYAKLFAMRFGLIIEPVRE